MITLQNLIDSSFVINEDKKYCDDIFREFGYHYGEYLNDIWDDDCPLIGHFHPEANWICTDTRVGIAMIFFKKELVAIFSQQARRSDTFYKWISLEAFNKVKTWVDQEFDKKEEFSPVLLEPNDDVTSWVKNKA